MVKSASVNFRIKRFSELTSKEKRALFKSFLGWSKGSRGEAISLSKESRRPVHVLFCAFLGDESVGFFRCNWKKEGKALGEGLIFAKGSRTVLKEKQKTVGRLLIEEAKSFAQRNKLAYIPTDARTPLGTKLFRRVAAKLKDAPKSVTRKESWKSRKK